MLRNRDVVGDADVRRERIHHRTVLFERQVGGVAHLDLIGAVASDREREVQGREAPRMLFAPRPGDVRLERLQVDPLLLEDVDDVGAGAAGRGEQQHLHRRRADLRVTVHHRQGTAGAAAFEYELFAPTHRRSGDRSGHDQVPRRVVSPR